MNPVHCCRMSNAGMPGTPSLACRKHAVPGNSWSGLSVASTIMSRSPAVMPADCRARCEASSARSEVVVVP